MKGLLRRVGGIGGLIALARSPLGRRVQQEITTAIRKRRAPGSAPGSAGAYQPRSPRR